MQFDRNRSIARNRVGLAVEVARDHTLRRRGVEVLIFAQREVGMGAPRRVAELALLQSTQANHVVVALTLFLVTTQFSTDGPGIVDLVFDETEERSLLVFADEARQVDHVHRWVLRQRRRRVQVDEEEVV